MRWFPALLFLLVLTPPAVSQPPDTLPPPPVPKSERDFPNSLSREYKELIPGLIESLKDVDPQVRQYSALALAALGPEAIKPLTEALKDSIRDRRAAAAYALGQMGYPAKSAVPALLTALKDDEAVVRRAASQAISRILNSDLGVVGFDIRPSSDLAPGGLGGGFSGGSAPQLPPTTSRSLKIPDKPLPPPEKPK